MRYNINVNLGEFVFYQIPKQIQTSEEYKDMSSDCKWLYTLMYDRNKVSMTNPKDFTDENGDIFIYFSIEQICESLNVGKDKALSIKKELRKRGLIEEVRQGLNKPNKIYVNIPKASEEYQLITEKQISGQRENSNQNIVKTEGNNNKLNKNNNNNIYTNVYEFYLSLGLIKHKTLTEAMKKAIKKAIKENNYTEEDMKELLKIHKNAVEATKGTNYAIKVRPLHEFFGQKILGGTALICTQYEEGGKYYKYKNNQPKQPKKQEKTIKLEEMF